MLCDSCGKNVAEIRMSFCINGVYVQKALCKECVSSNCSCSCCGTTLSDILEGKKCGCPQCYDVFGAELSKRIKKSQGAACHKGKKPDFKLKNSIDKQNALIKLNNRLNELVAQEEYETAAIVRDRIKELEAQLK